MKHNISRSNAARLKLALLLCVSALFSLSCSLSLNVNGPGENPTPTTVQDSIELAVRRTLTAIASKSEDEPSAGAALPDGTGIAENVSTLVAQAILTNQPTPAPPADTPARPPRTLPPLTAEIIAPSPPPPPPAPTETFAPTWTPTSTSTPEPTFTPTFTNTPEPTATPTFTHTPTSTPTWTPLPTNTLTPTVVPTHCPQQYCVIMQRCEPGENTRAVGTIYENDIPRNGVRVRVSYAMGGPPVLPDFISGNDPNNPGRADPQRPGYYQHGLLEGGQLAGNWWVFVVDEDGEVLSEGRFFNTQGQRTATSCQVGITDFYR